MSLVVLTNIPTPYRTAFFDALAEEAARATSVVSSSPWRLNRQVPSGCSVNYRPKKCAVCCGPPTRLC